MKWPKMDMKKIREEQKAKIYPGSKPQPTIKNPELKTLSQYYMKNQDTEYLENFKTAYQCHQTLCSHEWAIDHLATGDVLCDKCRIEQKEFQKVCRHGGYVAQKDLSIRCAFCGAGPPFINPFAKPQPTAAQLEEESKEEMFTIPNLGGV